MRNNSGKQPETITQLSSRTRRRWLSALGATATVGLAGCLGDDDDGEADGTDNGDDGTDDDQTGDETDADTDDGENGEADTDDNGTDEEELPTEQAQESYNSAITELVTNAERFEELTTDEEEATAAEIETFRGRLEDAAQSLDDAEAGADDELADQIEAARTVVPVQEALTEYHSLAVEFGDGIDQAFESWDTGFFEDAEAEFGTLVDMVGDIREQIEAITGTLHNVDSGPIEEPALAYTEDVWTYINPDGEDEVDFQEEYFGGFEQFSRLFHLTIAGEELYEQGEFAQAETYFADAYPAALETESTFDSLRNDPVVPPELQEQIHVLWEEAGAWRRAIELFEEAAQVAQEGDIERADEIYGDGLQELP